MPSATLLNGSLNYLDEDSFYIQLPADGNGGGPYRILFNNLPDISDSKGATYNDEPIMGRAFPLKTFSHSENRVINVTIHLFVCSIYDIRININYQRALQSCVYPRDTASAIVPYSPPKVCQLKFGEILGSDPLCAVLKNYSCKYPNDVAWDENTFIPYKFDIDTTWEAVYRSSQLPGADKIFRDGV